MSESSHFGTNLPRTESIREISFPTCSMSSSSTKSVPERSLCGGRQIETSGKLKNTPISIVSQNWNLNNYQLSTGLNKYPTLTYFSLLIYLSKHTYIYMYIDILCTINYVHVYSVYLYIQSLSLSTQFVFDILFERKFWRS